MKKRQSKRSMPKPAREFAHVLSPSSGRNSRHKRILDTLLNEITSGRFQPGDRLPSESELAETFDASRSTISRAIRELKERGLLNRQRGSGTHIAKQNEARRIALYAPFARNAAQLGFIGHQIHAHLSEIASSRADDLRLQVCGRLNDDADPLAAMVAGAQVIIDQGHRGVFYYPTEMPEEIAHYNQLVVDKLLAAGIAVIAVDRDIVSFPKRSKLPLVTYDNRRGGYLLTSHLIERGCKRVAFIGSPYVSSAASDRLRGYFDALEDHGIGVDRSRVFFANLEDLDTTYCRKMLASAKPDAIVCKMDHYAAAVGRQLMAFGKVIGRDILLAGFDDEPFAELLPVPLTTIRFPAEPFAQICYERLIAQMNDPTMPMAGMTLMDVELVVRASTNG